jgi:hypothetical protein
VCGQLAILLAPVVSGLTRPIDGELLEGLGAIGRCAEAERVLARAALRHPASSSDGWMPTKEYARVVGISEQAVRKRISVGHLSAQKRGRSWMIDPSQLPLPAA